MSATVFQRTHGRRQQFRSRVEGHNMRRAVYVCRTCDLRHDRKSKATKPVCDGPAGCGGRTFYHFPSTGEADRYAQLKFLESQGIISALRCQVREIELPIMIPSAGGGLEKLCTYRPDFVYVHRDRGRIVEDFKPRSDAAHDPIFRLKAKAVRIQHGVEITITT